MHRRTVPDAPRSSAQVQASRANGALSKGPTTADGKEIASRNAFTHGLSTYDTPVASGEDE